MQSASEKPADQSESKETVQNNESHGKLADSDEKIVDTDTANVPNQKRSENEAHDEEKHNSKGDASKKSASADNSINQTPSEDGQKSTKDAETSEQLKSQLMIMMSSLAVLSAEKSRMEANFQADKKQLRNERDECEKIIKELKEKLKKVQSNAVSEIEHVKCKLIMERHEREKEKADFIMKIKDLQKLLNEERRTKEQLELQAKSQFASKTQCKILEAELEITKNKLKQAEEAAKETPPVLLSLQAEMSTLKKQHRQAILEEQKRAAVAEQQARTLVMTNEARVASLEARLAELSEIVGGYDRLRQQDQIAIQKLKDQLTMLQDTEEKECTNFSEPEEIVAKIKTLYSHLLDLDNKKNDSIHVKSLLNSLGLHDNDKKVDYKEKYESLLREFEEYKEYTLSKHNSGSTYQPLSAVGDSYDRSNNKTQFHLLKTHNSNLEERIRMLNNEMMNKEKELQTQLDHQYKLLQEERSKCEQVLYQKEHEFRSKICALEQQLLNQRERSKALIEEKEKEILTLKASFHALLPKKETTATIENRMNLSKYENMAEPVADIVTGLITTDSPPILHYTQELARREVQISASRKQILELEASLREKQREILHLCEKHTEESKKLQAYITRLEACKSREGANLEYLKNVFVNYLTTNDGSSKRHMLNAISTILRFTPDELDKIKYGK